MTTRHDARKPVRGFSLIELLVSITIGLILTLAVSTVMIFSEKTKRSSTSVNDINQTGTYTSYVLDRLIRSAGSGFVQNWSSAYGCLLNVSQGGTQLLPLPSAMNSGSAFATAGALPFRLAPIVIAKGSAGNGGDVLIVMAGTAGAGENGVPVTPGVIAAGATSLPMSNALGFGTDDLVLLVDSSVTTGCLMEQIGTRTRTASSTALPLAGSYYTGAGGTVALTAFGGSTTALQLGNAGSTTLNMPQFQMIGVGSNNTLFSYDLLVPNPTNAVLDAPIADGIVEMRALYGITSTSTPANVVDTWVDPSSTSPSGDYSAATLTNGQPASQAKLRRILAVRLGLMLRTSVAELPRDYLQPTGTQLKLFTNTVDSNGASLQQTRTLTTAELSYRFRTIELTIPLRNALMAP